MISARTVAQWVLYLGMAVSMVGGAPWPHPNYAVVAIGTLVLFVGVFLKRRADAAGGGEGATLAGSLAGAVTAMPLLLERVRALGAIAESEELASVAREIEKIHAEIDVIAASQDDFVRRKSFLVYATVMAPLATGERLLYRAWSAASDGHREECVRSVADALGFVDEAQKALNDVVGAA